MIRDPLAVSARQLRALQLALHGLIPIGGTAWGSATLRGETTTRTVESLVRRGLLTMVGDRADLTATGRRLLAEIG